MRMPHAAVAFITFVLMLATTARADIVDVEEVACFQLVAGDPCGPTPCDLLPNNALCDDVDPACIGACGTCSGDPRCVCGSKECFDAPEQCDVPAEECPSQCFLVRPRCAYSEQCEVSNAPPACNPDDDGGPNDDDDDDDDDTQPACSDAGQKTKGRATLAVSGVFALAALMIGRRRKHLPRPSL